MCICKSNTWSSDICCGTFLCFFGFTVWNNLCLSHAATYMYSTVQDFFFLLSFCVFGLLFFNRVPYFLSIFSKENFAHVVFSTKVNESKVEFLIRKIPSFRVLKKQDPVYRNSPWCHHSSTQASIFSKFT